MSLEQHFEHLHKYPPAPFNPSYHPNAQAWFKGASDSMVEDGFYDHHTRAECAQEFRRRYEELKQKDIENPQNSQQTE